MNKINASISICLMAIIVSNFSIDCREVSRQDKDKKMVLPKVDVEKLTPQSRKVIQEFETAAKGWIEQARQISKLPTSQRQQTSSKFEKKFNKEFKTIQTKMNKLPTKRHLMPIGQNSIFDQLQGFIKVVNDLPAKIHFLIHGVPEYIVLTQKPVTEPATDPTTNPTTIPAIAVANESEHNDVDESVSDEDPL